MFPCCPPKSLNEEEFQYGHIRFYTNKKSDRNQPRQPAFDPLVEEECHDTTQANLIEILLPVTSANYIQVIGFTRMASGVSGGQNI